ncbi:PIN domain-containing protein [Ferruginibacter sp.]
MTGNKYLLDTSIVVHFFKKNVQITKRLDELSEVFISTVAIGELYYGAYCSSAPEKHIIMIEDFLQQCKIISIDKQCSITYGKIKAQLKAKGKPIPENDIWIASVALANNFTLFTTDNHFAEIPDIKLL